MHQILDMSAPYAVLQNIMNKAVMFPCVSFNALWSEHATTGKPNTNTAQVQWLAVEQNNDTKWYSQHIKTRSHMVLMGLLKMT